MLLAKASEITLFEWLALARPIVPGERAESQRGQNPVPEQSYSTFRVHLLPHSCGVFAAKSGVLTAER